MVRRTRKKNAEMEIRDSEKKGCSRRSGLSSGSSIGSEDEWMDVEEGTSYSAPKPGTQDVEITLGEAPQTETPESKAAKFLRLEVNRRIRERQVKCHKVISVKT